MKKILFLIPTLNGGGAEKVLVNLCNNLDRQKYKVTVMTIFDIGVNKQYLNAEIEYKYIFKKFFRGSTYILKIFSPEFLYKLFIKDEYDVMIAYLEGIATRILSGCLDKNKKKIAWLHVELEKEDKFFNMYRGGIKEAKKCYERFDKIVAVSNTALNSLANSIGMKEKMCVRYNIVENENIKLMGTESVHDVYFDKTKTNLVTVGRLTEQKGYDRLLRICNKLIKTNTDWHLYILGDGEKRQEFQAYLIKNNLTQFVTLLGYRNNPYKYIQNSDLFVCSSYREGFSTAVTEALILGVPIITTLCSGMEELLNNGEYGIIVQNNEESLYKGLYDLINHKEKIIHYKQMASKRSDFFEKNKMIQEIENLFQ